MGCRSSKFTVTIAQLTDSPVHTLGERGTHSNSLFPILLSMNVIFSLSFNQLDLLPYETHDKLKKMLLTCVRECPEGFGFA